MKISFIDIYFNGQTWNITEINGQLLIGHHDGAFIITKNNAAEILNNAAGFWNFTSVSEVFPAQKIIAGNYKGLTFLDYKNGGFISQQNIPDFNESSRYVATDKYDNIWVSHPYHGVYKIAPSQPGGYIIQLFTNKNGLPSTYNNHVFKIKNEVFLATEKGVYIYDDIKNIFKPSEYYRSLLGEQSLRYLKEDSLGNVWFIHEKKLGVIDLSGKAPALIYLPELENKLLSGFEFIYPVNEKNIFIGAKKGFFLLNFDKYKKNVAALKAQITMVKITDKKDSILFGGYLQEIGEKQNKQKNLPPEIENEYKTVHFEYASPVFGQQTNLEYSFRLLGFNDNWAEWSDKSEKEYTNLPTGGFNFQVKIRNNFG